MTTNPINAALARAADLRNQLHAELIEAADEASLRQRGAWEIYGPRIDEARAEAGRLLIAMRTGWGRACSSCGARQT